MKSKDNRKVRIFSTYTSEFLDISQNTDHPLPAHYITLWKENKPQSSVSKAQWLSVNL